MPPSSQTSAESEIYADLIETLFDTTHTLITGILSGVIVPLIAYVSTGDAQYLFLVLLLALLGVSVAIVFQNHHGEMISYYAVIIMAGVTGNLASRNAARPNIVFWQVMGTCAPLILIILLNYPPSYWGV